jgi:hypothetical protein
MVVKTVGELRKALEGYPDDLPLVGYNGGGNERPIDVYPLDPSDEELKAGCKKALMVDTD